MEVSQLSDTGLFEGLSAQDIIAMAGHAVPRDYPRNTIVLRQGEPPHSLYIVLSGKVKVYVNGKDGKELVLGTLGPNGYFGEMALIDDSPRSANVRTTTESKIAVVSKANFMKCVGRNPEIAMNLLRTLAQRVRELNDTVESLALHSVEDRVSRLLKRLATEKDGKLVTDQITQQELANMVGASREMVSRVINAMKTRGVIEVSGKAITLNEDMLAAH